jgi:cytochrome c5
MTNRNGAFLSLHKSTPVRLYSMLLGMLSMLIVINSAAQDMTQRQTELFANNCIQCHAFEQSGAPNIGDVNAWQQRSAKGEELLLRHVIEGFQGMPPLGYCSACNEQDFRVMVRAMADLPTPNTSEAN